MNVHNIMEEHVTQRVNELYDNLKSQNPVWLSCDCENCRLDTVSYVLNRIPPRYIVSGRGVTHLHADRSLEQIRADIDALSVEGIRLVSSAKRPYHNQNINPKNEKKSATPEFNFPIFVGQIFDGTTFEPLADATVLLKTEEGTAVMQDMTWANPCPTFSSTKGNYSFWVESKEASAAGENKSFTFTIEIEAPDYVSTSYSFTLPMTSESVDRTELNSTYSLKIQDLFLFKNDIDNPMED